MDLLNAQAESEFQNQGQELESRIRVHYAARLVAHYCSQGKRKDWIKPLFLKDERFNYCWGHVEEVVSGYSNYVSGDADIYSSYKSSTRKELIAAMLDKWPALTLDQFYPWPALRYLERHHVVEQEAILYILWAVYGFKC